MIEQWFRKDEPGNTKRGNPEKTKPGSLKLLSGTTGNKI